MLSSKQIEEIVGVITSLRKAVEMADKSAEYDAITTAYRLYGDKVVKIQDCYEESVAYSGTTSRNAEIIAKLLESYIVQNQEAGCKMPVLSQLEIGAFLKLYNRGGYVLDFSTNDFDVFTMNSIGEAICEKYGMSKGKSLMAYLNDAAPTDKMKLIKDLFDYYEANFDGEFTPHEDSYFGDFKYSYNTEYAGYYRKCKDIANRVFGVSAPFLQTAKILKDKFSSDYLSAQIDLMIGMQSSNPTEAIGKAKELIESCCKTILDDNHIEWDKNWDVGKLTGETVKCLKLMPTDIPDTAPAANEMRALLGNLRAIATNLAALRNPYGSGHGKSASYKGLEERHAKLAVGSSITLVSFLWDTHERRNEDAV